MNDTASKPQSPWRADKQPPFSDFIGMTVTVVSPEKVTATLVVREELTNRNGVMHGGAVMALADNMGGTAAVANLPEGFITSTIESKTNFFAGIAGLTLVFLGMFRGWKMSLFALPAAAAFLFGQMFTSSIMTLGTPSSVTPMRLVGIRRLRTSCSCGSWGGTAMTRSPSTRRRNRGAGGRRCCPYLITPPA